MVNTQELQALVLNCCTQHGVELYDIDFAQNVMRVYVDQAGGIDLEHVTNVTRTLSEVLDEKELILDRYTLEVSSPGVERPLRTAAHFEAVIGEKATIKTEKLGDHPRRIIGEVVSVSGDIVRIKPDDETNERDISLSQIEKARSVFEWKKNGKDTRTSGREQAARHAEKSKQSNTNQKPNSENVDMTTTGSESL